MLSRRDKGLTFPVGPAGGIGMLGMRMRRLQHDRPWHAPARSLRIACDPVDTCVAHPLGEGSYFPTDDLRNGAVGNAADDIPGVVASMGGSVFGSSMLKLSGFEPVLSP